MLVQHFLRKYASDFAVESPTISSEAMAVLQSVSYLSLISEVCHPPPTAL